MKDLKNEKRSIIFTTQFLDEAEELADQIGVLSHGKIFFFSLNNYFQGKLVAFGSADHIKKKFGVGFTLILQSK